MEEKEVIKTLKESKEILSGVESVITEKQLNELFIKACEIVNWGLSFEIVDWGFTNKEKIANGGFSLMKLIIAKDDKYKEEAINWFNNLKGKFKGVEKNAFIDLSINDLETDPESVRNMKIIYHEIGKTFGSDYVNQHLPEIMGNVAISASIDKLTAKVSELIEVLKQRG